MAGAVTLAVAVAIATGGVGPAAGGAASLALEGVDIAALEATAAVTTVGDIVGSALVAGATIQAIKHLPGGKNGESRGVE